MRIGKQWLDHLHYQHLKKQMSQHPRQRVSVDYKEAKSIGILTLGQTSEQMGMVNKFVQSLKQDKRQVKVLAYFNDKLEHPNFLYDYFGKKEVSLISKPKGPVVDQFIAQPFDILFNLCLEENLMLSYIAALSKAKMRIGPLQEKADYYDLMIDIPPGKGINYFIQQAEQILKNIKSEEHEISKL